LFEAGPTGGGTAAPEFVSGGFRTLHGLSCVGGFALAIMPAVVLSSVALCMGCVGAVGVAGPGEGLAELPPHQVQLGLWVRDRF
jgi:hypothetical protein